MWKSNHTVQNMITKEDTLRGVSVIRLRSGYHLTATDVSESITAHVTGNTLVVVPQVGGVDGEEPHDYLQRETCDDE